MNIDNLKTFDGSETIWRKKIDLPQKEELFFYILNIVHTDEFLLFGIRVEYQKRKSSFLMSQPCKSKQECLEKAVLYALEYTNTLKSPSNRECEMHF